METEERGDPDEDARGPERLVRWFDDRQRSRAWSAVPIGVIRKYVDDRGSALAGLLTFQIFLGLLPLLVIPLTVCDRLAPPGERSTGEV